MRTLVGLAYSPWTEKARWALDHHRVAYRYREHVPLLGEPLLRLRGRGVPGKVTVPMLLGDEGTVVDSYAIAQLAERIGVGKKIFPKEHETEIARWNDVSERLLRVACALTIQNVKKSPEAQAESLPPFFPGALRGLLAPMARMGASFLAKKYGASADPSREVELVVRPAFSDLRAALGDSFTYITGDFSFADIAMAVSLQFVAPVKDEYIALGPATRACWTHEALAQEFGDLLEWRDEIYAMHRRAG